MGEKKKEKCSRAGSRNSFTGPAKNSSGRTPTTSKALCSTVGVPRRRRRDREQTDSRLDGRGLVRAVIAQYFIL